MASKKPIVKKQNEKNFLTPDVEVTALVKLLSKKVFEDTETKTSNEFVGKIVFKITGNKTVKNTGAENFELAVASADPFRDSDVDRERVRSKGVVDRVTIENRNVLYLQSEQMYHVLYNLKDKEDAAAIASFLLRVPYDVKANSKIDAKQNSNLIFSFKDRVNLRDPWIVRKPGGQKQEPSTNRKPKSK